MRFSVTSIGLSIADCLIYISGLGWSQAISRRVGTMDLFPHRNDDAAFPLIELWLHSQSRGPNKLLRTTPTSNPSKFTFPFISSLPMVVLMRWVVIWKALVKLYRLGTLPRRNINPLSIASTREGSRKSSPAPKSVQNFEFSTKWTISIIKTINITIITTKHIRPAQMKILPGQISSARLALDIFKLPSFDDRAGSMMGWLVEDPRRFAEERFLDQCVIMIGWYGVHHGNKHSSASLPLTLTQHTWWQSAPSMIGWHDGDHDRLVRCSVMMEWLVRCSVMMFGWHDEV